MKLVTIILIFAILFTMGSAMLALVREPSASGKLVKRLTIRVGLSIFLFLSLIVGQSMGWLHR